MPSRPDSAALFHQLHQGPGLLTLPNAWDAGSARVIESLGAKAIATSSAGFAWSLGYPDGDALPLSELVHGVSLITRVVNVPVTVDMESGFGRTPEDVALAVTQIIDVGGVGMNIEDGSNPPEQLAAKITAVRKAAERTGVDFFVNARVDVYLRQLVPPAERVAESLRRAKIYRDAGASGIFVPAIVAPDEIRSVASGIDRPLNVLGWAGLPAAADLVKMGVKRLSAGAGLTKLAYGKTAAAVKAFLADGRSEIFSEGALESGALNGMMKR
ncbi:MAG: isocitrate lyase/phosphoenolpyruvate mutase family protein [Proteobacteria bacterium]|nr:isocitrate lyase/phosphoenolpyruvate mutase family protein [Pseudomonadota bacterium]